MRLLVLACVLAACGGKRGDTAPGPPKVTIIDVTQVMDSLNITECAEFPTPEAAAHGSADNWTEGFTPKNGQTGVVIGEAEHCILEEIIVVVAIGRNVVPILSRGLSGWVQKPPEIPPPDAGMPVVEFPDEVLAPTDDRDDDGVVNRDDACPYVPGRSDNSGCPLTLCAAIEQALAAGADDFANDRGALLPDESVIPGLLETYATTLEVPGTTRCEVTHNTATDTTSLFCNTGEAYNPDERYQTWVDDLAVCDGARSSRT